MAKVVLVSGDLMVMSRVQGAARKSGLAMATASGNDVAMDGDCAVVLIDLRNPGLDVAELVASLRYQPTKPAIVAFGPHVHEASLETAREAGCDMVVTRGQLERDIEAILAQYG